MLPQRVAAAAASHLRAQLLRSSRHSSSQRFALRTGHIATFVTCSTTTTTTTNTTTTRTARSDIGPHYHPAIYTTRNNHTLAWPASSSSSSSASLASSLTPIPRATTPAVGNSKHLHTRNRDYLRRSSSSSTAACRGSGNSGRRCLHTSLHTSLRRPAVALCVAGQLSASTPGLAPSTGRNMSTLDLGAAAALDHARYAVTLSSGKRLVVFRLPRIGKDAEESALPVIEGALDGLSLLSSSSATSAGEMKQEKKQQQENAWSYYAMEAECPHAGGPMTEAHIDIEDSGAYIASCPWHAYDFNVETGESSYGVKACTFPVEVDGQGRVILRIPGVSGLTAAKIEPVSEKVKFKHGSRIDERNVEKLKYLGEEASLCDWCVHILNTTDPELKIELTTHLFSLFATREQTANPMRLGAGEVQPPDEPPREDKITQVAPYEMPKAGRGGTQKSRVAMLHALANIEQWAIDLAIDICVRFATFQTVATEGDDGMASQALPRAFYYDWLKVANDEAKHFSLLRARLEEMGSYFGELPVHHGLWESAMRTSHDLRARISVIALVHEARGLDINPLTIQKFAKAKDAESVDVLNIIHNDEITHVTTGHRWLSWICEQEGTDAVDVFRGNVKVHFKGALKGPFNEEDRKAAGMGREWYTDLSGLPGGGEIIAGG